MQVLYKHVRGGVGGLTRNAYFAYVVRGVWGQTRNACFAFVVRGGREGQRQNAYVKDLNPYPPEKGL